MNKEYILEVVKENTKIMKMIALGSIVLGSFLFGIKIGKKFKKVKLRELNFDFLEDLPEKYLDDYT